MLRTQRDFPKPNDVTRNTGSKRIKMAGVDDVLVASAELDASLTDTADLVERKRLIRKHLDLLYTKIKLPVPDFETGLDWLNISEPLSLTNQLQGKLLVLDFFTYCCINCMHVLPDLEHLEKRYSVEDGVVILGVHSAKFLNEKVTANILSAILRYNITHPVVNDKDATLWQKLQIQCWPTFVIVGPQNQFLYTLIGEGHREKLLEFVEIALEYCKEKGEIKSHTLPVFLEKTKQEKSPLQFPGKISMRENGTLVISDTGKHRIVIMEQNGVVQEKIGGEVRGFKDGSFEEAQFFSPQGTASLGDRVFVADTDNHAVRVIDLQRRRVDTLVGTGQQGRDKEGGLKGTDQCISSPWDVAIGCSPESEERDVLYIAMAGTHQIWVYFLKDTRWYKGKEFKAGTSIRFAGSGNEENRNNNYPEKASFAQPSGLAVSPHSCLNCLYVADAESSSIRFVNLKDGAVRALTGGERDPKNLFAFGDADGVGIDAKLQHPLGVALVSGEGPLLVTDSYNHKIKSVNIKTKMCSTLIGSGLPGNHLSDKMAEVHLNEPGGLAVDQKRGLVYIADTNNHTIKVYDLKHQTLKEVPVIFPSASDSILSPSSSEQPVTEGGIVQECINICPGGEIKISISLMLEEGLHLNEDAPNAWKILPSDDTGKQIIVHNGGARGRLEPNVRQLVTTVAIPKEIIATEISLSLVLQLFVCAPDDTCRMQKITTQQPLKIISGTTSSKSVIYTLIVT